MKNQVLICPHCHEFSPLDATMCWRCFSLLSAADVGTEAESRRRVKQRLAVESGAGGGEVKRFVADNWPFTLVAAACLSGRLPRRWRTPVLGLSVTILGALCLNAARHNARHGEPERAEDGLAHGIVAPLFDLAYHGKAAQIRVEVTPRIVDVSYLVEGEWTTRVKFPLESWPAVREQIYQQIQAGRTPIYAMEGDRTAPVAALEVSARSEVDAGGETMILMLREIG